MGLCVYFTLSSQILTKKNLRKHKDFSIMDKVLPIFFISPIHSVFHFFSAIDDGGIMYGHDGNTSLYIYSQDVSVACPMANDRQSPPMYPAPLTPIPTPVTGFAFSLYNNVWNTNYIFWYPYIEEDADFKARFSMQWK